jgi:hypothetical protein
MIRNAERLAAVAALVLSGTALVLSVHSALAAATSPAAPPASAALERFKALSGDWVAAEDGAMSRKGDLVARYAVTAGGTAVVETVFPGSAHEMVTVYHADGADLVLTHYCMEGNQPRMRARGTKGPRFDFAFDGGTNIDPQRDRHMHSAWLEFVGADEIRNEWTELAEGKPVLVVKSHLVRKAH